MKITGNINTRNELYLYWPGSGFTNLMISPAHSNSHYSLCWISKIYRHEGLRKQLIYTYFILKDCRGWVAASLYWHWRRDYFDPVIVVDFTPQPACEPNRWRRNFTTYSTYLATVNIYLFKWERIRTMLSSEQKNLLLWWKKTELLIILQFYMDFLVEDVSGNIQKMVGTQQVSPSDKSRRNTGPIIPNVIAWTMSILLPLMPAPAK